MLTDGQETRWLWIENILIALGFSAYPLFQNLSLKTVRKLRSFG